MNNLAVELNSQLEGTVAARMFSELGKRMYFPKGIVAQAAEAKQRAHRFNATVGMAYQGGDVMTLPLMRELTAPLGPSESAAYAPTAGVRALRERWKAEMEQKNPSLQGKPTTLPAVVPGLTAGISLIAALFADTDSVLLLPDLFWGNYRLIFEETRGCRIREFEFFNKEGTFNRDGFAEGARSAAGNGKLLVLLNFPNNPSGFSPSREDVQFIVRTLTALADSVPLMVISDDAYFGLYYTEDTYRQSVFAELADAHPNLLAVKIDGATKEDFVWGFRVGFVTYAYKGITPEHAFALEQKTTGAIRAAVSSSSTLSQSLLLRAMNDPSYQAQKDAAFEVLKQRFTRLLTILERQRDTHRAPALEALPANSGYFMSFRCHGISAEELRNRLLDKGVGTISVKDTFLRVAFAGIDEDQLEELYEVIFQTAEELAS